MRTVDPVKYQEVRNAILDAAQRCFVKDGLRGTSIARICAEAKISPGHLYHYFESKEAIVDALTQIVLTQATERFGKTLQSADAVADLFSETHRSRSRANSGAQPIVLDILCEAVRSPGLAQVLQRHSNAVQQMLAEFLTKGQASRQIDPTLDVNATAALLIGLIDGLKIMGVRNLKQDRAAMAETLRLLVSRFLSPVAKK